MQNFKMQVVNTDKKHTVTLKTRKFDKEQRSTSNSCN